MTTRHAADGGAVALQPSTVARMSQQTAVAELGKAALGGLAVDDVFSLAIDLIRQVLDVEHVEILNESGPGESPLDSGAVGSMRATIPDGDHSFGVLGVRAGADRRFTTDDGDFLRSMAYVIGGTVQSDRARQQIELHSTAQEQRLRYQIALSTCAQALLSATGDTRLEHAV
ncbi:MAG: hypothetical protein M3096_04840, partial [Actinomycetia bacterium]|nr:hypothetical protein [Actinomycetes bacterium]